MPKAKVEHFIYFVDNNFFINFKRKLPVKAMSNKRPGVATSTSNPLDIIFIWVFILTPP